jgi:hypothetical protein
MNEAPEKKTMPASRHVGTYVWAACILLLAGMGYSYLTRLPSIPQEWLESKAGADPQAAERLVNSPDDTPLDETFQQVAPFARDGNAHAQFLIGLFFASGLSGEYRADYCAAASWFERASRQRHIAAHIFLASLLVAEQGVRADPELAAVLLAMARRGSEQNGNLYADTIRTVDLALQSRHPRFADPAVVESTIRKYRELKLTEIPRVTVQSAPDIPMIGPLIGSLLYNSSGCYEDVGGGFEWTFLMLTRDKSWSSIPDATASDWLDDIKPGPAQE